MEGSPSGMLKVVLACAAADYEGQIRKRYSEDMSGNGDGRVEKGLHSQDSCKGVLPSCTVLTDSNLKTAYVQGGRKIAGVYGFVFIFY